MKTKYILPLLMLVLVPGSYAQTFVGTIKKEGWVPTAIQIDQTHNKIFVADNATHKVFIFDGVTHAELGSAPTNLSPDFAVVDMVVNETYQKLYAATFELYINGKIAVIDTATGTFVKTIDLASPSTFSLLAADESLDKVYVLCVGGFGQIDVATDVVTWVPGVDGNPNRRMAVNPVTHEVFISNWMYDELDVVDGVTLTHTQVPDMQGLGVAVNWVENKVYVMFGQTGIAGVDYWGKVIDRDTGEVTVLRPFDLDPTNMVFNPLTNRMYTSSEWLYVMGIMDGATNDLHRLPLNPVGSMPFWGSAEFAVRNATDHVYYLNDQPIEVLDPTTELVERIAIDTPGTGFGSIIYSALIINQTTGRVYALPWSADDPNAYNTVLVIQDTDRLTRAPIFTGGPSVMDPVGKRWSDNLGLESSDGFPYEYAQEGFALSAGGKRIYQPAISSVVEPSESHLLVLAGSGRETIVAHIPTGGNQSNTAAVTPDGSRVYVANWGSNDVSVIDTASNLLLTVIPVGTRPRGITASPDGSQVYVALYGGDSVAVINTSSNTVAGTIPVGSAPWNVAFNPAGTFAYVSNSGSDNVSVIDVGQAVVVTNVAVGKTPLWLAVTPDGKQVYVPNSGAQTVSVIDTATNTVVQTVDVGASPRGVAASPDGSQVYVSTSRDGGWQFGYISAFAFINRADYSVTQSQEVDAWDNFGGAGATVVADLTSKFAGRVTSPRGAVAGAVVRALQSEAEKGTATTNATGDYSIFNLLPGTYDIEVDAPGCSTLSLAGQSVGIGRTDVLNPQLTTGECPMPQIHFSAASLWFGSQKLSVPTAAQTVTVTNSGIADLFITSFRKSGGQASDFAFTHTCPLSPESLAVSGSCTIDLTFTPAAPGPRKAMLQVMSDALGHPHRVMLTGLGTPVSLTPTSWDFGSRPVDTPSPPKAVTLTNLGSAPIHVWGAAMSGVHAEDFRQSNTCPAAPATLAGGASCTFDVTFRPLELGAHTAPLAVSHDGGGSPASVSLTGTAASALQTQAADSPVLFAPMVVPVTIQATEDSDSSADGKHKLKTKAAGERKESE